MSDRAAIAFLVAVILAAVSSLNTIESVTGQTNGVGAVSVDMDPTGNTATSLGRRQECHEALPGATIDIDVTVDAISSANPMVGYSFALGFAGPTLTVTDREQLMLDAIEGSDPFDVSEPLPQFDGNWNVDIFDLGDPITTAETGRGVLVRITLEVSTDAPPSVYALEVTRPLTLDLNNAEHYASTINNGRLAIGVSCAGSTPLPPVTSTAPQASSPGSSPGPGTSAPSGASTPSSHPSSPADGPSGSQSTPSPSVAAGETGTQTLSSPHDVDSNDDGGSDGTWPLVGLALIITAGIGGAGWLAYRRASRPNP